MLHGNYSNMIRTLKTLQSEPAATGDLSCVGTTGILWSFKSGKRPVSFSKYTGGNIREGNHEKPVGEFD